MVLINDIATGFRELDSLLSSPPFAFLVYGVAGSGKTSLLLHIATSLCREAPCLYISTEGTLHYERVARSAEAFEGVYFAEAYSLDELLDILVKALGSISPRYIFVDSINAPFRVEALSERSVAHFSYIIALARSYAEAKKGGVLASAQVHAADGDVAAVGESILRYYFDIIARLVIEGPARRIFIERPRLSISKKFEITERGIRWVD